MQNYPNLIFFTGRKRSGKDYSLKALAERGIFGKEVRRLSFSDELRRVANYIYPWLPIEVDDSLKDVPYVHEKNPNNYTPRQIWLHLGGEEGLRKVQPDLFLSFFLRFQMAEVAKNPDILYIVSDLRTPPEYKWAMSTGCPIIRISKADRTGIIEDDLESFIDKMVVDYEFLNRFEGSQPIIDFFEENIIA